MSSKISNYSSSTSDSVSNEKESKRRKRIKKHKRKEEKKKKHQKKEKLHKIEKRKYKQSQLSKRQASILVEDSNEIFGPVLPPHLMPNLLNKRESTKPMIGPIMPSDFSEQKDTTDDLLKDTTVLQTTVSTGDNDNNDDIGPLPPDVQAVGVSQIELEERALCLKLAAIDGTNAGPVPKEREKWMLELPEIGLKVGLGALNNMKRTFNQSKNRPDFSDRSEWTKTLQDVDKAKPISIKELTKNALTLYEKQRDAEQERLMQMYTKNHNHHESLMEMHQKKLREKERQRIESGKKPKRRNFDRNIDLKLNKIDKSHNKSIVNQAKILDTKFSSGQSKYL